MNKMICITTFTKEDRFQQHFYIYDETARDMDEAIRIAIHDQAVRFWEAKTSQDKSYLTIDEVIYFMKNVYSTSEVFHENYDWRVLMSEVNPTMKDTATPAKNSKGYIVGPSDVTVELGERWIGECK